MPVSSGSGNVTVNTDPNKLEIEDGDTVIVKEPAFTNISFSFTNAPSAGNARNMMKNITAGVMGMPYQYPDIVDMPIGGPSNREKVRPRRLLPLCLYCS